MKKKVLFKKGFAALLAVVTATSGVVPSVFAAEPEENAGANATITAVQEDTEHASEIEIVETAPAEENAAEQKDDASKEEDNSEKEDDSSSGETEKAAEEDTSSSGSEKDEAEKEKSDGEEEKLGTEDDGTDVKDAEPEEEVREDPETQKEEVKKYRFRFRFDEGAGIVKVLLSSDEGATKEAPSVIIQKEEEKEAEKKFRNDAVKEAVVEEPETGYILSMDLSEGEKVTVYSEAAEGYKVSQYTVETDAGGKKDAEPSYTELSATDNTILTFVLEKEEIKETEDGKIAIDLASEGGTVTVSGMEKTWTVSKDEKGTVTASENGQKVETENDMLVIDGKAGEKLVVKAKAAEGSNVTGFIVTGPDGKAEETTFKAEENPAEYEQEILFAEGQKTVKISFIEMPEFTAEKKAGKYIVKVHAPEGVFPAGTTVEAKEMSETESEPYTKKAEEMAEVGEVTAVIDIRFLDKTGKEIQPKGEVEVVFENAAEDNSTMSVYHAVEGNANQMEALPADTEGDNVQFKSNTFSPFVVMAASGEPDWTKGGKGSRTNVKDKLNIKFGDRYVYRYGDWDYGDGDHALNLCYEMKNSGKSVGWAVCVDPMRNGYDLEGETPGKVYEVTAPMFVKALYYGASGPGGRVIKEATGMSDYGAIDIVTHVAAAEIYARLGYSRSSAGDGLIEASSKLKNHVYKYVKAIEDLPVPDNYFAYVAAENGDKQDFAFGSNALTVHEYYLFVRKVSTNTDATKTDYYSLAGAQFAVYDTEAHAKAGGSTGRLGTITTTANTVNGVKVGDTPGFKVSKPGTYWIREIKAPKGFVIPAEANRVKSVTVTAENVKGKAAKLIYGDPYVYVALQIEKSATGVPAGTTAPSLKGTEFTVYSDQAHKNKVGVLTIGDDNKSNIITKDTGNNYLPLGVYYVVETKTIPGYKTCAPFTISATTAPSDGSQVVKAVKKVSNEFMPASIEIIKKSADEKITDGNSKYSLAGAQFGIYDNAACTGTPVKTITTDANGKASVDGLVRKNYWVKELKAPDAFYKNDKIFPVTAAEFEQSSKRTLAILETPKTDPLRITISKKAKEADDNAKINSLAGTQFEVKFYAGQYYKTKADLEGKTATRTWILTTYVDKNNKFRASFDDPENVSGDALYKDSNGRNTLPLGTVSITEKTAAPGYKNDPDFGGGSNICIANVVLNANGEPETRYVVGATMIENSAIAVTDTSLTPEIGTTAKDIKSDVPLSKAGGEITIEDTVNYKNFVIGNDYTIKGRLVDKATGETLKDAEGRNVTSETTFKAAAMNGSAKVTFTFKTDSSFEGKTVVAFETAECEGKEVAVHADINDEAQTIHFPKVRTNAVSSTTGEHVIPVEKETKIIDTVSYENLIPGKTYTVKGTVMVKETEKPLGHKGSEVTSTFTPNSANGTTNITFTVDATRAKRRQLVVFERLYVGSEVDENKLIGLHEDIGDKEQTVTVPDGGTTARDSETNDHISKADENVTIIDTVKYWGLIEGKEYTVDGVLMDKDTGKPVLVDGKEITSHAEFTADSVNRKVDLKFTFNASALNGKSVVAFETIKRNGKNIYVHADINDEDQTIHFPDGGTTAKGAKTLEHIAKAEKEAVILDEVKYSNLIPGKTYSVDGILMDKATKKAILVNGKEITSHAEFTAEKEAGSITLEFKLDASALENKSVVAFETVKYNGVEVFVHADINDEAQTVNFPEIRTTAVDAKTGEHITLAKKDIEINDTVAYKNLIPGKTYTVKGTVMVKETGKPLGQDGSEVTTTFTPENKDGTTKVTFIIDGTKVKGQLVIFEEVYLGSEASDDKLIGDHKDINDEAQTVTIPYGETTAKDAETNDHISKADEKVTVIDNVEYNGLIAGKKYTVDGVLMDKDTGKPVLVDGKEITSHAEFTAEKANGNIDLEFTFNASALNGKSVVAFETVRYNNIEVFVHADINDEDQTIHFPEGGTTAKGAKTLEHNAKAEKDVTIVDEVRYSNLISGKAYTVDGVLMDKDTGKAILVNGKEITSHAEFTAEKEAGSITLEFKLDASALENKSVVAFETVRYNGVEVFVHADINDEDQSVHFPEVKTNAVNTETGERVVPAEEGMKITDTISYKNLIPGKTYTVKGTVMVKETGKPLGQEGSEVTAQFTPDKADGTTEITFTIDTTELKNQQLVVFEELYIGTGVNDDKLVGDHKNINDKAQTVSVPDVTTDASDVKTKEKVIVNNIEKDGSVSGIKYINDEITFSNLEAGKMYEISGELKLQTGESETAWNDAQTVPSKVFAVNTNGAGKLDTEKHKNGFEGDTVYFIPESKSGEQFVSGSIIVTFEFDATGYESKDIIVGETVTRKIKLAIHNDLKDNRQTVNIPKGETTSVDKYTDIKNSLAAENRIFKDTFTYENLEPGKEYVFTGFVVITDVDENGQTVKDKNGNPVVHKIDSVMVDENGEPLADGCVKFTPEEENGTLDLYFMIDATEIPNRDVTVFEDVTRLGQNVIRHYVLDGTQTVYIPEGETEAIDSESQDHVAMPDEEVTIVDTLVFKNLIPGTEYTVTGRVMKKSDVTEVPSTLTEAAFAEEKQGTEISVEDSVVTFTPKTEDGALKLTFVFNGSELKGEDTVIYERVYHNNSEVIIHENINDEPQTVHLPDGRTEAADPDTDDRTMMAKGEITIRDRFFYENLLPGYEYAIHGKVMLKPAAEGEEPVELEAKMVDAEGNEIEEWIFTPEEKDGSQDIFFVINADDLAGRSVVMFEEMEFINPELETRAVIVKHEDIDDEDQTIHFPDGRTTALDSETQDHISKADTEVTIYDEVMYKNLIPGKTYTVKGTLMDKATGEPVMVNGEELTVTDEFTPEETDGSHVMTFTFDGSLLNGHTTVAYETVYSNGKEVFIHANIEDEDQTVHFPDGGTTATDDKTGSHTTYAEKNAVINDEVKYTNLIAGKEYRVTGVLMDKATGQPLLVNGKQVTADKTFTAQEPDGSVIITFRLDTSQLAGKSVVAYETVTYNDKEVFVHTDITDADQTIDIPSVKTEASDKADRNKEINPTGSVTVVDKVTYTNLTPGTKYVVKGVMMNKSTKKPAQSGGKDITGQASFRAEKKDGTINVEFRFNASDLKTGDYVVFEQLYEVNAQTGKETIVGSHEDINDKSQTIRRPEPPTPRRGARTSDDTPILPWVLVLTASIVGIGAAVVIRRKKTTE